MSTTVEGIDNLGPRDLDEAVHEAAAQLAADANNGGVTAQLSFLRVICGWNDSTIAEAVQRHRDDLVPF